jgi:hypothetical protein
MAKTLKLMHRKSRARATSRADLWSFDRLDWENDPDVFGRLCDSVITLFAERDGVSRESLFAIINHRKFAREVRIHARNFRPRTTGLVPYIYLHVKFALPPGSLTKYGDQ